MLLLLVVQEVELRLLFFVGQEGEMLLLLVVQEVELLDEQEDG